MVPEPPSRLDAAKRILGARVTEDRAGFYRLDGRPVSAMDLLREAGRVEAAKTEAAA